MDQELANVLRGIAGQLTALADGAMPGQVPGVGGELPGGQLPGGVRPGLVAVRPTGALGGSVVHWYPAPDLQENAWGYLSRLSRTKSPETGVYYFAPQLLGSYGLMQSTMPESTPWAEQADRIQHRELWLTQQQLDAEAEARQAWGEWAGKMGG